MNDQVTQAMATVMTMDPDPAKNKSVDVAALIEHAQVLGVEIERLQDWHAAIVAKAQAGSTQILVPPQELLRTMKRRDVYQTAAGLGYKEAGELAAEALTGLPAPDWVRADNYVDPDDEDEDDE